MRFPRVIMLTASMYLLVSYSLPLRAVEFKETKVEELRKFFDEYFSYFNAIDSHFMAYRVFSSPVVSVDPIKGVTNIYSTAEDRKELYDKLYVSLREQGWSYSEITELRIQYLKEDVAFVRLSFNRNSADGEVLDIGSRSNQLVVLKTPDGWRIPHIYSLPDSKLSSRTQLKREVRGEFERYLEYLNQNRGDLVANEVYGYPLMTRSWRESHHGIKLTSDEASTRLVSYLEELQQDGLDRFEVYHQRIQILAPTYALIHLESSRIRRDGSPIEPDRTKFSYVWIKVADEWKMVGVFGHRLK